MAIAIKTIESKKIRRRRRDFKKEKEKEPKRNKKEGFYSSSSSKEKKERKISLKRYRKKEKKENSSSSPSKIFWGSIFLQNALRFSWVKTAIFPDFPIVAVVVWFVASPICRLILFLTRSKLKNECCIIRRKLNGLNAFFCLWRNSCSKC